MKKNFFFAVAVIMMTLCTVFVSSCNTDDGFYGNDGTFKMDVKEPRLLSCNVNRIDYTTSGVVQTRGIGGTPEGTIDILSYHEATWLYGTDTVRHTYQGRFIQKFYDVKRTRYAHNADIFKNPRMSPTYLGDSILWTVSFKDTETHDFDISILELPAYYEKDYYQVGDSLMKLCKNAWVTRELIDAKVNPATSPDDKYTAYSVDLYFQFGVEEGPDNKKTCMVTLPLVLVPKGGPDVPIPDDKHDVISFEEVDKGYDLVNDSVNNRWIDLVKVLSDGSREPFPRVAFVSKNHLYSPEYQIKNVTDFQWQSSEMKSFDATPNGDWQKRENNIYVMPMTQSCATYTDKGTCVFIGDFDGQAYFVDSLNQKHYFLYKEYTFEDDGWQRSDMQSTENFERKLLSSGIRGLFNGATLPRTGEIELRKLKDTTKEIVGYWYSPLDSEESGLKPINPNSTYWTWRTQYVLFSDGSKEKVGEVGTTLNLATSTPEKQVVPVNDWDIKDLSAQPYDAVRGSNRTDKVETGTFTIQPYSKKYATRTNKSSDEFTTTYDGAVTFKDKYGQEVEFLALAVKQEDKGGVATMQDLLEQDGYERKSMTTSIAVTETHTSTSANYTAEVEFHKAKPEAPKIVDYAYENFAIKPVVPNKQYFTYCTRYAVKSDNTRENLGTFGTDLYINVTEPVKQTIPVQDWNINDLSAILSSAVAKGSRNDNKEEGTFKISKSEKSYTTKTNKSECKFVISYEGTVVFTDEFGKEVTFKGIEFSTKDNGGVKTLRDLGEADEKERKEMTSNITVTVNSSDNANYNGVVEFQKAVEKEQLISWSKTLSLTPAGNGMWTTSATITKVWKLAGTKTNTVSQSLDCSISGEAKKQVKLSEASAPYVTTNPGSWSAETSSMPQQYVTLYTKTNTTISENYTNLTDKYTAKMQRATYKEVVDGQTIEFDFLAPSDMTISHRDGNLTDGNRTVTEGNTIYDVYDHTGSVTATVTSTSGNQTQDATVQKEVLVAQIVVPEDPELGDVIGLATANGHTAATLTLRPNFGRDGKGEFFKTLVIQYQNGIRVVTTATYGPNAYDFTTNEGDKYVYGKVYNGITFPRSAKINSSAYFDGKFLPALITEDSKGWKYVAFDGRYIECSQNLADTRDIKNFTSDKTAECSPWLYYSSEVSNKTCYVKNMTGTTVYVTK